MNDQGITQEQAESDLYAVLGVAKDATAKEIHKAYKKLAKKFHPDVQPDEADADRFKEISAAYDVLGDDKKRAEYDEFRLMLNTGFPGGFGRSDGFGSYGGPGGFDGVSGFGGADINDLLGQMFADQGQRRPARRRVRVEVDFYDAIRGTDLQLQLTDGTATTVRIPKGADTGDRFLVRGEAGELIIEIEVGSHPQFGRDGLNLTLDVPISITEATLGGKIKVPTFDGKPVSLKIKPGTPNGRTLRVRGRGVDNGDTTGDLLVSVSIVVPTDLTDEQRDALARFAAIEPKIVDNNRI